MATRERWSGKDHPKKLVLYTIGALLLGFLLYSLTSFAIDKASGATAAPAPQPVAEGHRLARACITYNGDPCPTVTLRDKRTARKFRNGDIKHASGFNPRRTFAAPAYAKRIFSRRIARALQRSGLARVTASCDVFCQGRKQYERLASQGSCVHNGHPYPTFYRMCVGYAPKESWPTKHELQIGAAAAVCTSGVIIGVAVSPATAGTTAWIAGSAAAGCAVAFWRDIDPAR